MSYYQEPLLMSGNTGRITIHSMNVQTNEMTAEDEYNTIYSIYFVGLNPPFSYTLGNTVVFEVGEAELHSGGYYYIGVSVQHVGGSSPKDVKCVIGDSSGYYVTVYF